MKKRLALFLCLIGFWLCTTMSVFGQENGEYVLFIDNIPPIDEPSDPADVTFTVGKVFYATNNGILWFSSPQFADLLGSIREDLTKILKSKGFSVRGPYESYDLIPFQDKKAIDLLCAPTMELTVAFKDHQEKAENMWVPAADQIQTGNADVNGRIVLQMKDITKQELMWVKTIPFKSFSFPYFIKVKFDEYARIKKSGSKGLYLYEPIFDGMAKGVEEQYPGIVGTIDSLIDPEEMEIIKKQCQEIKSKEGY